MHAAIKSRRKSMAAKRTLVLTFAGIVLNEAVGLDDRARARGPAHLSRRPAIDALERVERPRALGCACRIAREVAARYSRNTCVWHE